MQESTKTFFAEPSNSPQTKSSSDEEYDFGSFQDLLARVVRYIHIILIILFVHLPKAMLITVALVLMCDPTLPNFILFLLFLRSLCKGVALYPRWVTSYFLCLMPLCCQVFLVYASLLSLTRRYIAQFSFMEKLPDLIKSVFAALGMVKWTPSISSYPSVGSTDWRNFTSQMWYGELEFFFTTSCGLILSVFMYYGRTAEENDNAEAIMDEQVEPQFHIEVNAVHKQFIRRTFPGLLQQHQEIHVSLRGKGKMKDVEELYRAKHTERM